MAQVFYYPPLSATNSSIGANGATAPSSSTEVGGIGLDGNLHALSTDNSGVLNVATASLPLPSGAATAAKQDTGNTSLASIDTKTPSVGQKAMAASSPVVIASDQSAIPVSAAALPLPAGAATAANQATANTSLGLITARLSGSLVPLPYDEIVLTYVPSGNGAGQIATAVYKLASATQATLTMTYDISDRLTDVIKS